MFKEIPVEEIYKYLTELATSVPDFKKPVRCPFLAVLPEDIVIGGYTTHFKGDIVCSYSSDNPLDIHCRTGNTSLNSRSYEHLSGLIVTGPCARNKSTLTSKIISDLGHPINPTR